MRFVTSPRLVGCAFTIAGAGIVAGCGSGTDVDNRGPCAGAAPPMASIGPLDPSVVIPQTVQLNALLRCGVNGPTVSVTWTWRSSNPAVVSVDANGLATAVASGTVTITATPSRYPASAASTSVRAVSVSSFVPSIQPPALIVSPGATHQFRATISEQPNVPVAWSIDPSGIATIDAAGLVQVPRCGALGAAVITARNALDATASASAALTVVHLATAPLAIQAVRDSITGEPLDLNHTRGTIAIRVNLESRLIECGRVSSADVILKSASGEEIALAARLPVFPETTAELYFATAARATDGQPRTPNGSYSLRARAFDVSAKLIEETPPTLVRFDNP